MMRFGSRRSTLAVAAATVLSCIAMALVPLDPANGLVAVIVGMTIVGSLINGLQTNLYALTAQVYPPEIRATGVGATAAIGRLGAMLSSFVGAIVVGAGGNIYFGTVAAAMTIPLVALALLHRHTTPIRRLQTEEPHEL
jgi:AAHS family 4-hydroxybenzoate transporter-like MFS transporter